MKTLYETVAFMLFGSVCLGVYLVTGYLQSLKSDLPAKQEWITQPASYQEYKKDWGRTETYGSYQIVLAPDRTGVGVECSGYESDETNCGSPSIVNFVTDKNVNVELDCHLCYESGNVYGGWIRMCRHNESWQMSFLNVGAEGILFADSLPPDWANDLKKTIVTVGASELLQKKLDTLRQLPTSESDEEKRILAESISGNLVYLIESELGHHPGHRGEKHP